MKLNNFSQVKVGKAYLLVPDEGVYSKYFNYYEPSLIEAIELEKKAQEKQKNTNSFYLVYDAEKMLSIAEEMFYEKLDLFRKEKYEEDKIYVFWLSSLNIVTKLFVRIVIRPKDKNNEGIGYIYMDPKEVNYYYNAGDSINISDLVENKFFTKMSSYDILLDFYSVSIVYAKVIINASSGDSYIGYIAYKQPFLYFHEMQYNNLRENIKITLLEKESSTSLIGIDTKYAKYEEIYNISYSHLITVMDKIEFDDFEQYIIKQ